jgi:putative membrane protein
MYLPLILSFLMILGITVFALQNGVPLEVNFLLWGFKTSLIAIILGSVLIGAIIVSIFSLPLLIKKHFHEKRLAKQISELEKKSQELENQSQQKKSSAFTSPTTQLL